jgi:hypothetical protein
VTKKKVTNISDIDDEIKLPNGASVQRTAFDCEVCIASGEEPGKSEFLVEYEGQQLNICGAHMQKVLDESDNYKEGGILEDAFSIEEPGDG